MPCCSLTPKPQNITERKDTEYHGNTKHSYCYYCTVCFTLLPHGNMQSLAAQKQLHRWQSSQPVDTKEF